MAVLTHESHVDIWQKGFEVGAPLFHVHGAVLTRQLMLLWLLMVMALRLMMVPLHLVREGLNVWETRAERRLTRLLGEPSELRKRGADRWWRVTVQIQRA